MTYNVTGWVLCHIHSCLLRVNCFSQFLKRGSERILRRGTERKRVLKLTQRCPWVDISKVNEDANFANAA